MEIVFAAGCFWGVEKAFSTINGVQNVMVGYTAGNYANPTYQTVLQYRLSSEVINHTEAVKVLYDEQKITTKKLIQLFWELHNPTQGDCQGNDVGSNYRSGIYWTQESQKQLAYETKNEYQQLLRRNGYGKITTEILKLDKFYIAEDYHQNYLTKNPTGYCPNHSTGVKFE